MPTASGTDTIVRELGGWRQGDARGRVFLIASIGPDSMNPGDKQTTAHSPIEGPCRKVTYAVDFRTARDLFAWTRGDDAVEMLSENATLTHPEDREAIEAAIRILDRWHMNTAKALCVHAPAGAHICPGRGYGCSCCPTDAPARLMGEGSVRIVASGTRPGQKCTHDVVGVDFGCGYPQGSAWLVKPLTPEAEAEIRAAIDRIQP